MMHSVAAVICTLPAACAWAGITEVAVSPRLSASSAGCTCVMPTLGSNERWMDGCVGGCGGKPFHLHKQGGIVRSITVWYGTNVDKNDGIKAIRIGYFGDTNDLSAGHPSNSHKEITFQPGETIKGDVTLSGNGFATRTGYIAFSTSAGQTFAPGQAGHTKYLYDSGDSFISGIVGRAGADIDALAFIFWKPIQALYFTGISYPTLDSLTKVKSPTAIASQVYCNDNDEPRPTAGQVRETTETTGHDSCFTASATETFGGSISVKAGIPDLVEATDEAHWEISSTQTFNNCQQHSSSTTNTLTFPSPTLQPHTRTSYQYTQWQGAVSDLPFTATLKVTFSDGSSINRIESGTYKGTSYLSVQQSWTDEETDVKDCSKWMASNSTVLV